MEKWHGGDTTTHSGNHHLQQAGALFVYLHDASPLQAPEAIRNISSNKPFNKGHLVLNNNWLGVPQSLLGNTAQWQWGQGAAGMPFSSNGLLLLPITSQVLFIPNS